MSCNCEPTEFSDSKKRTARKEHKCAECKGVIRIGHQYVHISYKCVSDYRIYRVHLHLQCDHDWSLVMNLEYDAGFDRHEAICQCWGHLAERVEYLYREEIIGGNHELAQRHLADKQWFQDMEEERRIAAMSSEEFEQYQEELRLLDLERIHEIYEENGQERLPL